MPAGGHTLTESKLRAMFKCSQLFQFGGEVDINLSSRMAQYAVEYYLSAKLRSPGRDRSYLITKAVFHAAKLCELSTKYMTGQAQQHQNRTALWLGEFLKTYPEDMYYPVTGPLPWRTKISSTAVDLRISGILRTAKNQTLHVLCFTPYNDRHSQVNDPITHLKVQALQEFVKKNYQRPRAMMHMLWVTAPGNLGWGYVTSKDLNPDYLQAIETKIKQVERDEIFPLLPCPYQCRYKNKCYPGEAK